MISSASNRASALAANHFSQKAATAALPSIRHPSGTGPVFSNCIVGQQRSHGAGVVGAQTAVVSETAGQILDVAERLAQTRGFNGFSYADIAGELGVTKASLHYHFPGKADLGRALIERYTVGFAAALERIEHSGVPAFAQLQHYVAIYGDVLKAGRICLCGMLAAEYTTLPAPMQDAIRAFLTPTRAGCRACSRLDARTGP